MDRYLPDLHDLPDVLDLLTLGATITFPNGCVLSEAIDVRYFKLSYHDETWVYPKSRDGLQRALHDTFGVIEAQEDNQ